MNCDPCLAFLNAFFELLWTSAADDELQGKSSSADLKPASTVVVLPRAVLMNPAATREAHGARHSGRAGGKRRGASARADPRGGKSQGLRLVSYLVQARRVTHPSLRDICDALFCGQRRRRTRPRTPPLTSQEHSPHCGECSGMRTASS